MAHHVDQQKNFSLVMSRFWSFKIFFREINAMMETFHLLNFNHVSTDSRREDFGHVLSNELRMYSQNEKWNTWSI